MPTEAFLAYGYEIEVDTEQAVLLVLSAAHAEGRMHQASAGGLLDDPDDRDSDYQLSLIGLHLQQVGDGHRDRTIVASRLYLAEAADEEPQPVDAEELDAEDADRERLRWAMGVLGCPSADEPGWLLGISTA